MTGDVAEVQSELQTLHSSHKVETKARISHAACAHFCKAVPHPVLNRKLPINNKRWMTNECLHTLQTHSLLFYDLNHASHTRFSGNFYSVCSKWTKVVLWHILPMLCTTGCTNLFAGGCSGWLLQIAYTCSGKLRDGSASHSPPFSHSLCQVLIERGGGKSSVFCFGGMNAKSHLILWEQPQEQPYTEELIGISHWPPALKTVGGNPTCSGMKGVQLKTALNNYSCRLFLIEFRWWMCNRWFWVR